VPAVALLPAVLGLLTLLLFLQQGPFVAEPVCCCSDCTWRRCSSQGTCGVIH
jgi:hypothetical protein